VIGVLGAITATVGNTAAFVQDNIKRLLAYSSIAHAGYMLCAMALIPRGGGSDGGATQVILIYLAVYLFMNLGAFTVAGVIYAQTGSENIHDYAGMSRRSPLMSICMAMFMVSLIGLPPLAGFAAKLNIMYILAAGGGWLWALVVIIGVNTILSLYYYLRVVRMMFFGTSDRPALSINPLGSAIAVVCAAMLVLMLICYQPLYRIAGDYGKTYVAASSPKADMTARVTEP
jgi:NADH-quinone oxidoreductase subunit N